jgi:hypothetical protein
LHGQHPIAVVTVSVKDVLVGGVYLGEVPDEVKSIITDTPPFHDGKPGIDAYSHPMRPFLFRFSNGFRSGCALRYIENRKTLVKKMISKKTLLGHLYS